MNKLSIFLSGALFMTYCNSCGHSDSPPPEPAKVCFQMPAQVEDFTLMVCTESDAVKSAECCVYTFEDAEQRCAAVLCHTACEQDIELVDSLCVPQPPPPPNFPGEDA
jgi:hypothetical protein